MLRNQGAKGEEGEKQTNKTKPKPSTALRAAQKSRRFINAPDPPPGAAPQE